MRQPAASFGEYLESLPEELLENVSEDYLWLAASGFRGQLGREFERRKECCRQECLRRGRPAIFRVAQGAVAA